MPNPNTNAPGLVLSAALAVSMQELAALQGLISDSSRDLVRASFSQYGPIVPVLGSGALDKHWLVEDAGLSDGTVTVYAHSSRTDVNGVAAPNMGVLVTAEGDVVPLDPASADTVAGGEVTDDSTWYSVVVRAVLVTHGRGEISVGAGSAAITGAGTRFGRLTIASDYPTGTTSMPAKIKVAGTASNDGTRTVVTITDDQNIVVDATFAATEVIPQENWSILGRWFSPGTTPADQTVQQRYVPEFEILPRVTIPAAGDYVLADVNNTGGLVTVVDRRQWRSARLVAREEMRSCSHFPIVRMEVELSAPYTAVTRDVVEVAPSGADSILQAAVAPSATGRAVALLIDASTSSTEGSLDAYQSNQIPFSWTAGGNIDTGVSGVSVLHVPAIDKHFAFYIKSGVLYQSEAVSGDVSTWSAGSLIWDPTTVDPANALHDVSAKVLPSGRVLIVASYKLVGIVPRRIQAIYSDDYGTSWETNGDLGRLVKNRAPISCTRPSIDVDASGRIWLAYEHKLAGGRYTVTTDYTDDPEGLDWVTDADAGPTIDATDGVFTPQFCNPVILCGALSPPLVILLEDVVGFPGHRKIWAALITPAADGDVAQASVLFQVDGSTAPPEGALGAAYLDGGSLVVVYNDDSSPKAAQSTRLYDVAVAGPIVRV